MDEQKITDMAFEINRIINKHKPSGEELEVVMSMTIGSILEFWIQNKDLTAAKAATEHLMRMVEQELAARGWTEGKLWN